MHISEFEDAYEDDLRTDDEFLSLPISQIEPQPAVLIEESASVAEAVLAMNVNHTGCVLVMHEGRLTGIFTERDVLTRVFGHENCQKQRVGTVMTKNPETLNLNDDLAFALHHMSVGGYRHIPIMEHSHPVGVLSVRNIVDYLAGLHPEDVMNLPPNPGSAIFRTVDGG